MISTRKKVQEVLATTSDPDSREEERNRKGMLAQYIHSRSHCARCVCKSELCRTIPPGALRSELFARKRDHSRMRIHQSPLRGNAHRGTPLSMRSRIWIDRKPKSCNPSRWTFRRIGDSKKESRNTRHLRHQSRGFRTEPRRALPKGFVLPDQRNRGSICEPARAA